MADTDAPTKEPRATQQSSSKPELDHDCVPSHGGMLASPQALVQQLVSQGMTVERAKAAIRRRLEQRKQRGMQEKHPHGHNVVDHNSFIDVKTDVSPATADTKDGEWCHSEESLLKRSGRRSSYNLVDSCTVVEGGEQATEGRIFHDQWREAPQHQPKKPDPAQEEIKELKQQKIMAEVRKVQTMFREQIARIQLTITRGIAIAKKVVTDLAIADLPIPQKIAEDFTQRSIKEIQQLHHSAAESIVHNLKELGRGLVPRQYVDKAKEAVESVTGKKIEEKPDGILLLNLLNYIEMSTNQFLTHDAELLVNKMSTIERGSEILDDIDESATLNARGVDPETYRQMMIEWKFHLDPSGPAASEDKAKEVMQRLLDWIVSNGIHKERERPLGAGDVDKLVGRAATDMGLDSDIGEDRKKRAQVKYFMTHPSR